MASISLALVPPEEQLFIDKVIRKRLGRPGALLGILEEVQAHHPRKYLLLDVLRYSGEGRNHLFGNLQCGRALCALQSAAQGELLDQRCTA